jgi:hypothetical protein
MFARLLVQARLCFEEVSPCGPGVRRAPGHLLVPEVGGGRAAVRARELELGGRVVVELRRLFERVAQFQTLTSR